MINAFYGKLIENIKGINLDLIDKMDTQKKSIDDQKNI